MLHETNGPHTLWYMNDFLYSTKKYYNFIGEAFTHSIEMQFVNQVHMDKCFLVFQHLESVLFSSCLTFDLELSLQAFQMNDFIYSLVEWSTDSRKELLLKSCESLGKDLLTGDMVKFL